MLVALAYSIESDDRFTNFSIISQAYREKLDWGILPEILPLDRFRGHYNALKPLAQKILLFSRY